MYYFMNFIEFVHFFILIYFVFFSLISLISLITYSNIVMWSVVFDGSCKRFLSNLYVNEVEK